MTDTFGSNVILVVVLLVVLVVVLVIILTGSVFLVLAVRAPERLTELFALVVMTLPGRKPPSPETLKAIRSGSTRDRARKPAVAQATEAPELEEAPREPVRPRKWRGRLVTSVVVALVLFLLRQAGLPWLLAEIRNKACPPSQDQPVVLRADFEPPGPEQKTAKSGDCSRLVGGGWCGLMADKAPYLERFLVALHVCPGDISSASTTVYNEGSGRHGEQGRPQASAGTAH